MPAALKLICSNNVNRFFPTAAADFTFLLALRMMAPLSRVVIQFWPGPVCCTLF
jgi:hypothetical protein